MTYETKDTEMLTKNTPNPMNVAERDRPSYVTDALQGIVITATQASLEADGFPVDWKQIAESLARDCGTLVDHMHELEGNPRSVAPADKMLVDAL